MNFDRQIASELGVNCAIILSNIQFWVEMNEASRSELHYKEGQYWTFNAVSAYEKIFDFMTKSQIRTALDKLEEHGYIHSGRFNKFGADKTKWYRPSKKALKVLCDKSQISLRNLANQSAENNKSVCEESQSNTIYNPDIVSDIEPVIIPPTKVAGKNKTTKIKNDVILTQEETNLVLKFRGLFCPAEKVGTLINREKAGRYFNSLLQTYSKEQIELVMQEGKKQLGVPYQPQVTTMGSLVSKYEQLKAKTLPRVHSSMTKTIEVELDPVDGMPF
jgi:hypothetical protein